MNSSHVLRTLFVCAALQLAAVKVGAVCHPFRVHLKADPPPRPPSLDTQVLPDHWENQLLDRISSFPTLQEFRGIFERWRDSAGRIPDEERFAYLKCVEFYVSQDTDGDSIPDWTPIIDGKPSKFLYPQDDDQDGDGVPNLLDPQPLDAKKKGLSRELIPSHLQLEGAAGERQRELFKEFGILAVNHTDSHSPAVLKELLVLLRQGFPPGAIEKMKSFRTLYAFAGHDRSRVIAAYHVQAQAISIGGVSTYGEEPLLESARVILLASLAHEMGHAFILGQMSAEDLKTVAVRYGGWSEVFQNQTIDNFYAAPFFKSHPLREMAFTALANDASGRSFTELPHWRYQNMTSRYSTFNVHEWFAESFAAQALRRLGASGEIGAEWKAQLIQIPSDHRHHWTNFNNLTDGLQDWIEGRLTSQGSTAGAGVKKTKRPTIGVEKPKPSAPIMREKRETIYDAGVGSEKRSPRSPSR